MPLSMLTRLARRYRGDTPGISRREMLQRSAALAAGLLISGVPGCSQLLRSPSRPQRRIVIVGGGFAGLACGYELADAGYDVTVLEARRRVGGRVLSFGDFVPGKNVEGGGEFIGANHPTWLAYSKKFGLDLLEVTEDEALESPIMLQGRRLSAAEAQSLWEQMDVAVRRMSADAAAIDEDEPWRSPRADELDRMSVRAWLERQTDISSDCRAGIATMLMADNGVTLERQSYLGLLTVIKGGGLDAFWSESEVYRCKGGNAQLAGRLADSIGRERVIMAAPVRSIRVDGDAAHVHCVDGRRFEADEVVVAVPPSVWPAIEFSPGLPKALNPQMGCNIKYLARVSKPFWLDRGLTPYSLADGDLNMTWELTDNQPGDGWALGAFSGGTSAEACRSRSGDALHEAFAAAHEAVHPGYREHVLDTRFMDWPSEPWTKGGYTFPAPGQVCTVGPMLRKGLGRLHFAGEHSCYKFVGFMEGGLNSGVSLAQRMACRDGVLASV